MIDNKETLSFFPQPVFKYKVDNFKEYNEKLSKYIYDLNKDDKDGILRSNRGGWHSKPFNLKDTSSIQHKFLLETTKYVFDCIKTLGWRLEPNKVICTEMWAIINKKDDFNIIHTHPNSYLSAAYYVKAPKDCGQFTIENPHSISRHSYPALEKKTDFNLKVERIEIEEGDLLLFPAYLPHGVQENKSNEDRIVISFNININNFK
tara:strand:- start:168 stop:782 length:615 start_codon:yes stop_codon:yes gene_type:complete